MQIAMSPELKALKLQASLQADLPVNLPCNAGWPSDQTMYSNVKIAQSRTEMLTRRVLSWNSSESIECTMVCI